MVIGSGDHRLGSEYGCNHHFGAHYCAESAEAQYRGRVLSVFSVGMVGSAPIGAIILGWIIETFGTLNALVPAMFVSLLLFLYGVYFSKVWAYRSVAVS